MINKTKSFYRKNCILVLLRAPGRAFRLQGEPSALQRVQPAHKIANAKNTGVFLLFYRDGWGIFQAQIIQSDEEEDIEDVLPATPQERFLYL